jgi:hypothetical protein
MQYPLSAFPGLRDPYHNFLYPLVVKPASLSPAFPWAVLDNPLTFVKRRQTELRNILRQRLATLTASELRFDEPIDCVE